MPLPYSHPPHLLPLSWKDALQWVPPWDLEQLASSLPEVHAHRLCVDGVGLLPRDSGLTPAGAGIQPTPGSGGRGALSLGGASGLRWSGEKLSGTLFSLGPAIFIATLGGILHETR